MTTECMDDGMRDLLPELGQGSLSSAEVARIRAHVASCAACAEELRLLEVTRQVLVARAPQVDVAAVVAAVTAARVPTPALTVVRGTARPARSWMPRQYVAAAASLLILATLALPAVRERFFGAPSVAVDSVADVAGASPEVAGLALAGGLGDLSDEDLAALLAELDAVEPTVAQEPVSLRSSLVNAPEGP